MLSSDPRQAIVERLSEPRGQLISQSARSPGGWQSSIREAGGEDADPRSIRFLKERAVPGHQLYYVVFNTRAGEQRQFVVGVMQQADGNWDVRGSAGGGGGDPVREHPWINFGAWGWPRFFSGGGKVIGAGSERATHARLRFADGTTLEDVIDAGIVLFMSDGPVRMPVTVEILDQTGAMLTTYQALG